MRRDEHAPPSGAAARQLLLEAAVHAAGRLVEADDRGRVAVGAPSTIASASRCFSPPERSRGWRSARRRIESDGGQRPAAPPVRPSRGSGSRSGSAAAARPGRRSATRPRVGSSARRRVAAASTCRRRCVPSAPPARRGRSSATRREDRGPSRSSCQTRVERSAAAAGAARRDEAACVCPGVAGVPAGCAAGAARRSRSAARAALTPGAGWQPEAREQPRARRLERRGGVAAHSRNAGERVAHDPAGDPSRSRGRRPRQRSSRCSASSIVTSEVLVEPPQRPDQLIAGDRVELRGRLVEHDQRGAAGERGAERDALELAAGQLRRRAVEQMGDPERERRLLDAARDRRGRSPRFSRPNASSARTVPITTWVSGSWNSVPTAAASSPGPCSRVSMPGDRRPPGERAAVEVRHEPAGGAQQRRLARAGRARDDDQLAGLDLRA